MRKGLLSSVATALVGAGSALAQNPYYLPTDNAQTAGVPALLSADPAQPPAAAPTAPPTLTGGSTGLVPGLDCLPATVPNRPKIFGDIGYMLTWVKDERHTGPLAISSPAGAPLFGPGTVTLIGGQDTSFDGQNGVRASIGTWLGCDNKVGVEAGGFILQKVTNGTIISSDGSAGNPVLARPFIDLSLVPPGANALLVAGPGVAGAIIERETTRLWGAETNGVVNWVDDCHRRTDLLIGASYTELRETLGIASTSSFATPVAALSGSSTIDDAFGTRNQFYAGQVGARTTWTFGQLSLIMSGTIAAGVNHESVDRYGNSSFTFGGVPPTAVPGGFLVQSSNTGHETRDKFAVGMPSQILVSYQVTDCLKAYVGYDFIYISNVARPGDQIDLVNQFNPTTGAAIRPFAGVRTTDFWANSLVAGLAFNY